MGRILASKKFTVTCLARSSSSSINKCKFDVKKQIFDFLSVLKKNARRYKTGLNNQLIAFVSQNFSRTAHPQQNFFRQLPYEMLLKIFESLPIDALRNLACTCQYFCRTLQTYYLSTPFRRRFDIFSIADFGMFLVRVFLDRYD